MATTPENSEPVVLHVSHSLSGYSSIAEIIEDAKSRGTNVTFERPLTAEEAIQPEQTFSEAVREALKEEPDII